MDQHTRSSTPAHAGHAGRSAHADHKKHGMYGRLVLMLVASFVAMYFLMYAMVDSIREVIPNVNQGYMAAIMTGPMGLLELSLMSKMYPDKTKNLLVALASLALLGIGWWGMRSQAAIGDEQFLKSMIPHHSGALLMCRNANLESQETRDLCKEIIDTQIREIAEMRALLQR